MSKTNKVRFELYVSPEMAEAIRAAARSAELRSPQQFIYMAIASYIRNWAPPLAKRGKPGQRNEEKWPSGWPVHTPCPAGGCNVNHDPAWHLENEPRLVRADNVRRAFAAAGLDSDSYAD